MLADILHLLTDFFDLNAPPLLVIDNRVYSQRQVALELGHACVGLLHLLSNRLIDSLSLLHLLLEGSFEVLDLLVDLIQKFQLGSDGFYMTIYIFFGLKLNSVEVVHDLNGDIVYVPVRLCES